MTHKKAQAATLAALRGHEPEALITFRVSVLSQLLSRVVEGSVGGELGLSSRQWRVLVMLNRLGPTTSGQVAAATHFDHSQVSRASYELLDKGLIAMENDPDDRRRQRLSVTPAGVAVLRRGIVGSAERQARLRECLGEADYEAFGRIVEALTVRAQAMIDESREARSGPGRPNTPGA